MKRLKVIFAFLVCLVTSQPLLSQQTFHDFIVFDIHGEEFDMAQLEGKKVLVVNTASTCGLTPQYAGLQELFKKYGDENFMIIAFPCNDFGSQESGTNEEIATFCSTKYQVTFPVMSKVSIKGSDKHPIYKWLTEAEENGVADSKVTWNFQKYMIDGKGKLVGHEPPRKRPACRAIVKWIEKS